MEWDIIDSKIPFIFWASFLLLLFLWWHLLHTSFFKSEIEWNYVILLNYLSYMFWSLFDHYKITKFVNNNVSTQLCESHVALCTEGVSNWYNVLNLNSLVYFVHHRLTARNGAPWNKLSRRKDARRPGSLWWGGLLAFIKHI